MMDINEVEENFFAANEAKLHGGMCKQLSAIYCKVLSVFPSLEAAQPRSRSGMQALCTLHLSLEKVKNVCQHCSECSKLYLAITADSVLLKFEKAKSILADSLRHVEDIVPHTIGCQISEIVNELENTMFFIDPSEKQVGDKIIMLLQQGKKFDNCNENNGLENFHQAASSLGITSSRAALTERRALKKLIQRARAEEDKRKESIVAYLLHLMRKYSKLFRSDFCDDNDSQSSAPCSPTVKSSLGDGGLEANSHLFDRQLSKLSSFNFKPSIRRSGAMPVPPEELRCPISLQLMYDPVIISSGQTYERISIEKWFSDGHNSCPKTQQKLSHLNLIPNYCVKGLVTSWCEQNGVPLPDGPPDSLDLNYWRLALSECESTNSRSMSIVSCKLKEVKVVPLEETVLVEEAEGNELETECAKEDESELNFFENYLGIMSVLNGQENLERKCIIVEQIRLLLKDDEEARTFMGANGFTEALLWFLESAVNEGNTVAQETGALALFNLAVNNDRNKETMLAAGIISLLEKMTSNSNWHGAATALYLNLSCLDEAKTVIGSSHVVSFLLQCLRAESETQSKLDALHTLYNLSTNYSNITNLLSAGIISVLQSLVVSDDHRWTEKSIAVLINLASSKAGKDEMVSSSCLIGGLAMVLDSGEDIEQEQAAACLFILCNENEKCSQMVLEEGIIPALVSISVNGTARGKEKAQKLLMLFREQRQGQPPNEIEQEDQPDEMLVLPASSESTTPNLELKPRSKSVPKKKIGRGWSFFRKKQEILCSTVLK